MIRLGKSRLPNHGSKPISSPIPQTDRPPADFLAAFIKKAGVSSSAGRVSPAIIV
jgi:hypothetical protein